MKISAEQIFEYLTTTFPEGDFSGDSSWYMITNPLDKKSKSKGDRTMGINPYSGFVHCFRTGYNEHIVKFISEHKQLTTKDAQALLTEFAGRPLNIVKRLDQVIVPKDIHYFKDYYNLKDYNVQLAMYSAWEFMKSKYGLLWEDLIYHNLGIGYLGETHGRIYIPCINEGSLQYYLTRAYIDSNLTYKNAQVPKRSVFFNKTALTLMRTVQITESWACSIVLGRNSAAALSWKPTRDQINYLIHSPCQEIYVWPDKGIEERSGLTYTQQALQIYRVVAAYKKVFVIDAEKYEGGKDPSEIGYSQCERHKQNAIQL